MSDTCLGENTQSDKNGQTGRSCQERYYNSGDQKRISVCTAHLTLRWMQGYETTIRFPSCKPQTGIRSIMETISQDNS